MIAALISLLVAVLLLPTMGASAAVAGFCWTLFVLWLGYQAVRLRGRV